MKKLVMIIFLFLLILMQNIYAQTWQKTRLDRGEKDRAGQFCTIAVDDHGYSHISYMDYKWNTNDENLRYAYQDNTGWHIEKIDFTDYSSHVGFTTDIALDSNGNPHIIEVVLNTYDDDLVRYLYKEPGGLWVSKNFIGYVYYYYSKIEISNDDNPYLLYGAKNGGDTGFNLVMSYKNNGYWYRKIITNNLDRHTNWDQIFDFTLDGNNKPIVCYFENGSLMLSHNGSKILIDNGCDRGHGCSVDYDADNDIIWVVYHHRDYDNLNLAIISDDDCNVYILDNIGGKHPSITLDKAGFPHIAYFTGSGSDQQELRYIYQNSDGWFSSTVDHGYDGRSGSTGGNYKNISLGISVNKYAQAYICYQWLDPSGNFNDNDYHLYFAKNTDKIITVNPIVSLSNYFIKREQTFQIMGSGFSSNGQVTMYFKAPSGSLEEEFITADKNGDYSKSNTIPSNAELGVWEYWAKDLSSGISSDKVNYHVVSQFQIFTEDFESFDGSRWQPSHPSECTVETDNGDKAYCIDATYETGVYSLIKNYQFTDFDINLKIRNDTDFDYGYNHASYFILFNYQDSNNQYYLKFCTPIQVAVNPIEYHYENKLYKIVNGNTEVIKTYQNVTIDDKLYHDVRVKREDNQISVYYDNNEIMSVYDDATIQGKIGIGAYKSKAYFDDINIRLPDNGTAIELSSKSKLIKFALQSNYPNPFNSTTNITFDVPKASHVTLKVYDITGKHIKTLVDEHMNAGNHSVKWYGKNSKGNTVPSGIYLCRIQSDGYTNTISMLYSK